MLAKLYKDSSSLSSRLLTRLNNIDGSFKISKAIYISSLFFVFKT
tara:strand:+ start:4393 stop:4527 length:135 start_codon:yes stop_codon:yes gene_type:complete